MPVLGRPGPAKRAGSSDAACRHGLIWDHTVFHVVPHWRARPKIVAPSKRNCRIAQHIARVPRHPLPLPPIHRKTDRLSLCLHIVSSQK